MDHSNKWRCNVCTMENSGQNEICAICMNGCRPDKWRCDACTLVNDISSETCKMCEASRPPLPPPPQPSPSPDISIDQPPQQRMDVDFRRPPQRNNNPFDDVEEDRGISIDIQDVPPRSNIQIDSAPLEINGGGNHNRPPPRRQPQLLDPFDIAPPSDSDRREIRDNSADFMVSADELLDTPPRQPQQNGYRNHQPGPNLNINDPIDDNHNSMSKIELHTSADMEEKIDNNDSPMGNSDPFGRQISQESNEDIQGTEALIAQLMAAEMCSICKQQQGVEMGGSCSHKMCAKCGKMYLLEGVVNQKWEKEIITCPVANCTAVFPDRLIRFCGLNDQMADKVKDMQSKFSQNNISGLVTCPNESCNHKFMAEPGKFDPNAKEIGLNGVKLSREALQHKAEFRFRCPRCAINFCKKCKVTPYHAGYTCEDFVNYKKAQKCRFCEDELSYKNLADSSGIPEDLLPGLENCCTKDECLGYRDNCCGRIHPCGHKCIGVRGEKTCPPCIHEDCVGNEDLNDDEFCNICWVDALKAAPCLKLECGHFFHAHCVRTILKKKWSGARILFKFMECPLCKKEIKHYELKREMRSVVKLRNKIEKMAVDRLKIENMHNDKRLKEKGGKYYKNPKVFAMDRLAFYTCYKCSDPYFGGMRRCEEAGMEQNANFNAKHLLCGRCSAGPNSKSCSTHGTQYITWKCKFCCGIGSWYCWGNTHFCDDCHTKQEGGDYLNRKPISALPKCKGPGICPLGGKHPPNGTKDFSLGCVVCLKR